MYTCNDKCTFKGMCKPTLLFWKNSVSVLNTCNCSLSNHALLNNISVWLWNVISTHKYVNRLELAFLSQPCTSITARFQTVYLMEWWKIFVGSLINSYFQKETGSRIQKRAKDFLQGFCTRDSNFLQECVNTLQMLQEIYV